jgi:hypothetical protein
MPIIVVTSDYCYDGRKHAKIPLNGASEDSNDMELEPLKPKERLKGIDIRRESYCIAEDMKDVYALKVIHVSEPSTTNPDDAKTTVIGENIYFERDEKAMKELNDALSGHSKRSVEVVEEIEPSLLQKVRRYRSTNEKTIRTKSLLDQIKASNKRIQSVKAGCRIVTDDYSLDECIEWALTYVVKHVDSLSAEVLEIIEELEAYEESNARDTSGSPALNKKHNTKSSRTEKNSKLTSAVTAASISQQLEKCSVEGLETFMQAQILQPRKLSKSRYGEIDGGMAKKSVQPALEAITEDDSIPDAGGLRPSPPTTSKPSSLNGSRRGW